MLGFDIGIDLGTANTRVIVRQKIVLKEASAVAMDAETMRPIAYGNEARRMVGRTHKKIKTVLHPEGCIVFNSVTEESRAAFIRGAEAAGMVLHPSTHIALNDYNPIEIMKATLS